MDPQTERYLTTYRSPDEPQAHIIAATGTLSNVDHYYERGSAYLGTGIDGETFDMVTAIFKISPVIRGVRVAPHAVSIVLDDSGDTTWNYALHERIMDLIILERLDWGYPEMQRLLPDDFHTLYPDLLPTPILA